MEDTPEKQSNHHKINNNPSISFVDIKLPLEESNSTFNLENAVCSHGLFLMAPNQWDPQTKSLIRPLRLSLSINGNACSDSALVRISSGQSSDEVFIRVYGKQWLSAEEKEAVVEQVKRMLRLSEREEIKVREFQELHTQAKKMGFGRVFRSPTLFEDMVKAILFCNCQYVLFFLYFPELFRYELIWVCEVLCSMLVCCTPVLDYNELYSNHLSDDVHFSTRVNRKQPYTNNDKVMYSCVTVNFQYKWSHLLTFW